MTLKSVILVLAAFVFMACEDPNSESAVARRKHAAWVAECHDESVLLAITAGSPSEYTCPNQQHVMHVQVASQPSNEEFGALVFCQCARNTDAGNDAP